MATFMSIVKYDVDELSGKVTFLSGFTKPYGSTQKKQRVVKKLDTGDIDTEIEL
jgi:hypothetical protein